MCLLRDDRARLVKERLSKKRIETGSRVVPYMHRRFKSPELMRTFCAQPHGSTYTYANANMHAVGEKNQSKDENSKVKHAMR